MDRYAEQGSYISYDERREDLRNDLLEGRIDASQFLYESRINDLLQQKLEFGMSNEEFTQQYETLQRLSVASNANTFNTANTDIALQIYDNEYAKIHDKERARESAIMAAGLPLNYEETLKKHEEYVKSPTYIQHQKAADREIMDALAKDGTLGRQVQGSHGDVAVNNSVKD